MDKKNILLVGSSFYPMKDPRSLRITELAKEFARQGHMVTVLVPKNEASHKTFEEKYNLTIKDLGPKRFKDIDITKGSKISILIKRFLRRMLDLFFHYPNIEWMFKTQKALKNEYNYDLLITIAVPHPIHWGTARVWRKNIAKVWAADCGDPFMGLRSDTFKKMFYFKFFEKKWCDKADYIVVPFNGAKESYYKEYLDKIKVIPQGLSFPTLNKRSIMKNNIVTFVYSGNIGSYKHYYIPFFNFLKEVDIDFRFIVFTKESYIFEKYAHSILNKIELNDYVDRETLIPILNNADFLVHFPYEENGQKSLKLIDYFYAQAPILSYKGILDNKVLSDFLKGDYTEKITNESIDQYRIENVCKQFLELV